MMTMLNIFSAKNFNISFIKDFDVSFAEKFFNVSFAEKFFDVLFAEKFFNVSLAEDFCTMIKLFLLNLIITYIEALMFAKDFEFFDKIFRDRLKLD